MEERPARATLVSAADLGDGATVISKSEIEAALASDGEPIELVLDLAGDGEAGESRSVPVSWERFDLERLLEQVTSDEVTLTFDREALWQAAATDVEAHGIREAVVTLAVAATVATGAAAQASAYPSSALGDSTTYATQVAAGDIAPDDRAVPRPTPVLASTPDLARMTGPCRGPRLWRYRRRTSLRTIGPCRGRLRSRRRRRTSLRTTEPYRGRRRSRHLPRIWLRTTGQCHGRRRWRRPPHPGGRLRAGHRTGRPRSAASYPRCTAGDRNGVRRDVLGANSGRDRCHCRCDRTGHRRRVLPRRRPASPTASGVVHG